MARSSLNPPLALRGNRLLGAAGLLLLLIALPAAAAETVRVGVLQFGTVHWLLDVIQQHHLAAAEGVDLQVTPLGSKNAVSVALQGGSADVIVNDWLWVARQRTEGRDYTFVPYSVAVGALMVRPDAHIKELADLSGRRLGVAGGPVDKSWLLLRAYAKKTIGADLKDVATPVFAAPPLLNQLMLRGELPATLNYWHYGARLQAAGMTPLITVKEMLTGLGITGPVPMVGWVFHEQWARDHPKALKGFLKAVDKAQQLLALSNTEWERLRPLMKAEDDATFVALRETYRAGIPVGDPAETAARAAQLFRVLAREGGPELVGTATELAPGTFWIPAK